MRVRYYGHFGLQTGYGRAATDFALALHRHTSLELDLRCLSSVDLGDDNRCLPLAPLVNAGGHPDVVLVHTLPRDCPEVLRRDGSGATAVAYTTWEAMSAPQAVLGPLWFAFDQVLTPSKVSAHALGLGLVESASEHCACSSAHQWRDARIVPHCFDESLIAWRDSQTAGMEGAYSWDQPFTFYTIGSWNVRKNPHGVIRAFASVFGPRDPVQLVVHCPGVDEAAPVMVMASLNLPPAEMPKVVMSRQPIEANLDVMRMHKRFDCFVSASRGEAWNLGAFEAALFNRHTIVPRGLGSDDFLEGTSAHMYSSDEAPAQLDVTATRDGSQLRINATGPQGLTGRQCWREPRIVELAQMMAVTYATKLRDLHIDHYDFAGRYSYAAVAEIMTNALEEARG